MKKVVTVIFVLLTIILGVVSVMLFMKNKDLTNQTNVLVQQNAQLQNKIDAVGEVGQAWTVVASVFPGKEIKDEDLIETTQPLASMNENYVLNKADLVGKFYKIGVSPGTPITKDLVMAEESEGTLYERDITLPFLPVGLRVGDYVDLRVVLPYGEEMIALEHERVYAIVENVIKVKLTESELHIYTSMLKDLALYGSKGLQLYATKYVEPGLHDGTIPYYPVRKDMEGFVMLDPNVADKADAINAELRDILEKRLANIPDSDKGLLNSGAGLQSSTINAANKQYSDVLTNSEDYGQFDSGSVSMDGADAAGNSSSITESDREQSKGEPLFEDEGVIQ